MTNATQVRYLENLESARKFGLGMKSLLNFEDNRRFYCQFSNKERPFTLVIFFRNADDFYVFHSSFGKVEHISENLEVWRLAAKFMAYFFKIFVGLYSQSEYTKYMIPPNYRQLNGEKYDKLRPISKPFEVLL